MARRGRKPSFDLASLCCPNPDCPDHGQSGAGRIVANGTYSTRAGKGRRYKCKTCGQSFCQRTGSVFQTLRTPDDKVMAAIKLLVKGMTMRRVGQFLEVKPDTVKRWLSVAAANKKAINEMLCKELGTSEAELASLWEHVENNDLRPRAVLWRQRCGWRQGPRRRSSQAKS